MHFLNLKIFIFVDNIIKSYNIFKYIHMDVCMRVFIYYKRRFSAKLINW